MGSKRTRKRMEYEKRADISLYASFVAKRNGIEDNDTKKK
jgi:hypothetical protein